MKSENGELQSTLHGSEPTVFQSSCSYHNCLLSLVPIEFVCRQNRSENLVSLVVGEQDAVLLVGTTYLHYRLRPKQGLAETLLPVVILAPCDHLYATSPCISLLCTQFPLQLPIQVLQHWAAAMASGLYDSIIQESSSFIKSKSATFVCGGRIPIVRCFLPS